MYYHLYEARIRLNGGGSTVVTIKAETSHVAKALLEQQYGVGMVERVNLSS